MGIAHKVLYSLISLLRIRHSKPPSSKLICFLVFSSPGPQGLSLKNDMSVLVTPPFPLPYSFPWTRFRILGQPRIGCECKLSSHFGLSRLALMSVGIKGVRSQTHVPAPSQFHPPNQLNRICASHMHMGMEMIYLTGVISSPTPGSHQLSVLPQLRLGGGPCEPLPVSFMFDDWLDVVFILCGQLQLL